MSTSMKPYAVVINGTRHVLLLDEEDAKRYAGAQLVNAVAAAVAEVVEPAVHQAAQPVELIEPVEPVAEPVPLVEPVAEPEPAAKAGRARKA